jgi:putative endonuclease
MTQKSNIILGKFGEKIASEYLQKKGFKIISTNFKKKHGDIDIVAYDHETLVFIEVKTRSNDEYGQPEDTINTYKIKRLIQSANYYCLTNNIRNKSLRIDIISIKVPENIKKITIKHFQNITS